MFHDRHSAGRQLGARLAGLFRNQAATVVGLSNGGVPVGWEIARSLGAPLDVFFVRPEHMLAHDDARELLCRAGRHAAPLSGRVVIVADDGVASGATMRDALLALRGAGACRLVVAVPVAPQTALDHLHELADAVVCLKVLPEPTAIGLCYQHFGPVTQEDVRALLRSARSAVRMTQPRHGRVNRRRDRSSRAAAARSLRAARC